MPMNHALALKSTEPRVHERTASRRSTLHGPSRKEDRHESLYAIDFQLDSGHGAAPNGETGDARVYEMHYVSPGHTAVRLARIYVTGDEPCYIINRAQGAWRHLEARTEYWHVDSNALAMLVASPQGGKLVLQIAHEGDNLGTLYAEAEWDQDAVVEQVMSRDVEWQPSTEQGVQPPPGTYLFAVSGDTPPQVLARQGCLLALSFTVTDELDASGQTRYRLDTTEWYQGSDAGLLFAGWRVGDGVVLEKSETRPDGVMHYASCSFHPTSGPGTST